VQRLAIPETTLAVAGDAVDENDVGGNVLIDVVADVILNRGIAIDVGTNLGEDLVPRPADIRVEVTPQRAEVLVEDLRPALPARLDPFPRRRTVLTVTRQPALVAFDIVPAASDSGAFDNHLGHVGAHQSSLNG
jgi:hypothetical protein